MKLTSAVGDFGEVTRDWLGRKLSLMETLPAITTLVDAECCLPFFKDCRDEESVGLSSVSFPLAWFFSRRRTERPQQAFPP